MNKKLLLSIVLIALCHCLSKATTLKIMEDSTSCILFYELELTDNGDYLVSLISDTTWTFPRNIVSTAQVTIKVPTGGFQVGEITDLIDGIAFFKTGRDNAPPEDPLFDYISFSLGSQGTSRIPFDKGQKVALFSFNNIGTCPDGEVHLMDNFADSFFPPNSRQSNAGQQMTVSGFGAPDLPVGILGSGLSCNPTDTNPIDTMVSMPIDTMASMPVDTMVSMPVDTVTNPPIDTTDNSNTPPFVESDLTVQLAVQQESCAGAGDGIIVLKAANGVAPYSYSWSTGATTSSLENLSPGTYSVTIVDQTGFTIERTVTIIQAAALNLFISKANASQSGTSDGSGRAIVTGGTAPYSFLWSTGAITGTLNNLSEGDYSLTVTDAHGCTDSKNITIVNQSLCPTIDVLLDMKSPSCAGDGDGQILATPQGGQAPFSYVWEIGNGNNFISNISSGDYMVTLTDASGCTMAVSAMLPDATPMEASLNTISATNGNNGSIAVTVTGGTGPYTYAWDNGALSSMLDNIGSGVYALTVTDNSGCFLEVSAIVSGTTSTGTSCNLDVFDAFGSSVVLGEVACEEKGTLCLPVPLDSMIHYGVFLDGEDYSSNLKGCQFETYFAYSYAFFPNGNTPGNYNLREWTINGTTYTGTFGSIDALVDSLNVWDNGGNWVNIKSVSIIQGGQPSNTYGAMVIVAGSASTILDVNSNQTPTGTEISFKPGNHELIIIRNSSSCADTLAIELPCNTAVSRDSIINITIGEGEQASTCLTSIFGDNIQVSDNTCPNSSGTSAGIIYNPATNCIDIAGFLGGTEQACYQLTDATGTIINLTIVVTVQATVIPCTDFMQDSLFVFAPNCDPLITCIDLPFSVLSNAVITVNGSTYTGSVLPCEEGGSQLTFAQPGSYNLSMSYGDNCTSAISVIVACDTDEVIEQTIELGTSEVVCVNIPGILGIFETVDNICPERSSEHVIFETLANSGCISYTGITVGSDTACIKACDLFGFCDTVMIILHVEDNSGTPPPLFNAVDDSATIRLNSSVVIDVLGNDVFRNIDTIYKVSEPASGQAFLNPDATITYIAQTGYCDENEPDTFLYGICESGFCDTATVAIYINCFLNRELTVYTGVSPNGDGINDSFVIEGLENYPNNTVSIFNRWGNVVFSQKGYKNEWDGKWNEDKELPDGTYFYILNLGDGSKPMKGFMEVRR